MIFFEAIFFILPAYISNSLAALSAALPIIKKWNTPIDFHLSWANKRLLGNGKTFRGLIFGILIGSFVAYVQFFLLQNYITLDFLKFYNTVTLSQLLFLDLLLAAGALLGDIIKSFVKRRIDIKRGRPWPPFDQLDFILGAFLISYSFYFPGLDIFFILIIFTPIAHLLTNILAYKMKIKDVWW